MKKILIAFSGGPDSVYLYYYLKNKGYKLAICYVNHNLRHDVQKDIEFVKRFSKNENIPCFIENIHLSNFSENLAREKRYELLEKCRINNKYDLIATGHNKNDNVETIIFRLIRGTGIEGLKGIPRKRLNIIRPILDISKEQILKFLKEHDIEYLIDYTNNTNDYSRNLIRNKILPLMSEVNENYLENISRFIKILNENSEIKENIKKELNKYKIPYSKNKIDEIYSIRNSNGASIRLNASYIWYKTYNFFGIKKIENFEKKEIELKLNENANFNTYSIVFSEDTTLKNELEKKGYKLYNVGDIVSIKIRTRMNGDRIDNIKLKKILTDRKIDKFQRNILPVILHNNNIIILADIKKSKKLDNLKTSRYVAIKKGE